MENMDFETAQKVLLENLAPELPNDKRDVAVAGVFLLVNVARSLASIAATLKGATGNDGAFCVHTKADG